ILREYLKNLHIREFCNRFLDNKQFFLKNEESVWRYSKYQDINNAYLDDVYINIQRICNNLQSGQFCKYLREY
ncbi:hypothetical protein DD595_26390, partial [Enterobacter cloacae complex sp. 4DZ3-17B2]